MGTPADRGYDHDDVWLKSADGTRLHGWLIKPATKPQATVYFLHGNAENISTHVNATFWLIDAGIQVFALDYRGYGQSDGVAVLPDVLDDIHAGYTWLSDKLEASGNDAPVYIFAQSLGASLAIKYLDVHPQAGSEINAAVLEAAFARYGGMARHVASDNWITWLFQYPVDWIITNRYDPLNAIDNLAPLPLMLLHSRDDVIVPYSNVEQLYQRAGEPKVLLPVTGPHIAAVANPVVRQNILDFMSQNDQKSQSHISRHTANDDHTGQ